MRPVIDTNSHLLPGLDHGCPDMETSVLMARAAFESGVDTIVCTPHLPDWDEALIAHAAVVIEEARAALAAAAVGVRLLLGFEVDLSIAATESPDRLRTLAVQGPGGDAGHAILLETPYGGWPVYIEDVLFRLSSAGFTPVLAHPERNDRIQDSSDRLRTCLNAGAVAQATAGSLSGMFGRPAVKTFHRLLGEGLISMVASDAHANMREGWTMTPMLQNIAGRLRADDVTALSETNPRLLLEGEPLLNVNAGAKASSRGSLRRPRFG